MLGVYENFPETIHRIALFASSVSNKRLQQALIETLEKLNNETLTLETIADPSVPQCTVSFELGIAETASFNYLDNEEASRILKMARKNPFQIMDFLCAVRYHKTQGEKKRPLRFDYYMLRFTFDGNSIGMLVFHERGPRYMSPEDIINLFANRVNQASQKRIMKALDAS
jgi:hypothetical protein